METIGVLTVSNARHAQSATRPAGAARGLTIDGERFVNSTVAYFQLPIVLYRTGPLAQPSVMVSTNSDGSKISLFIILTWVAMPFSFIIFLPNV